MEKPTDNEKCISILALRTLNCSQDEVANVLHCSKRIVGEVEQWIYKCDLEEASRLCDDQSLRRLVGREFPGLEEISNELLIKAGQLTSEDILRHYREDFALVRPMQDPITIKTKGEHQSRLRNLLVEWMKQLPPPLRLPYLITQGWLRDEMPKERIYEILEQANTTKLFEDALEQQEMVLHSSKEYCLPVENDPEFANLRQHLADYPVVDNYDTLKRQSAELSFDYGILIGTITETLSTGILQQHYGEELPAIISYEELVRISSHSKSSATIIGTILSCDLLAFALNLISESYRATFGNSLRETRSVMALALSYMVQNHSQLSSDLTSLGIILWNDQNDPIQVQKKLREILLKVGRSQKVYDELLADFQSILSEEHFPGQCSICSLGS